MDILYAPWREAYFTGKSDECVFCSIANNESLDDKNKVIYRNSELFVVMNKFPYTPGHILIVPNIHIDSPELLKQDIWLSLFAKAQKSTLMLYEFGASGINMGMNIKQCGGAGIPEHLHLHLLPRWKGDTNFITSIGNTRSYGNDFENVYLKMKELAGKYLN